MKISRLVFLWLAGLVILSACARQADDSAQPRQALVNFFDRLSQGSYAQAAELYGGSYETLQSWNPDLNPKDTAALWQNGCQVNGLQCLTVHSATLKQQTKNGKTLFIVEFNNPDGSLFSRPGCCGDNATPPTSQFEFRLLRGEDGKYRVMDMPVYVP
jgi:hypothetical protein